MTIKTYKPNDEARIEAMLFGEDATGGLLHGEIIVFAQAWAGDDLRPGYKPATGAMFEVKTLEGWVAMPFGSYLAKGTNGEFYPIHPDIMAKRWVEVT